MSATAPPRPRGTGVAFLLAQLGQHATTLFADRVAVLGLTPPQAGILRAVSAEPGRSQQALSEALGLLPSRLVAFIDDLEDRGYVERRRNAVDRRLYALHLTASGEKLMDDLAAVGRQHEQDLTRGLDREEAAELARLLTTIAGQHGLTPGIHPGYRAMGERPPGRSPQG